MKKSFKLFAMAAAALALVSSCKKDELVDNTVQSVDKVHFVIRTGDVKTSIVYDEDGKKYTPLWDGGDELGLYFKETTQSGSIQVLTNAKPAGYEASFEGDIEVPAKDGYFYSFVPAQRFQTFYSSFPQFGFNLGDKNDNYIQHPLKNSFDPLCDLLLAYPTYYFDEDGEVLIDDFLFARMFCILKVQLTGDVVAGDKVSEIKIAGEELTLSGRFYVDPVNMTLPKAAAGKNYVWAKYDEAQQPVMGTDAIYLIVNPQTVEQGTALAITAETDKHSIEKALTLSKGDLNLKQGKVITLNVTVTADDCKTKTKAGYILQTTSGAFEAGAKYIFAFKDGEDGSYYFIGSNGTSNQLHKNAYSVVDDVITTTETDMVFIAAAGETSETFTFKNESTSKYIYYSGSGTELNTKGDNTTEWKVEYLSASNTYKIYNIGTNRYIGAGSTANAKAYAAVNFKDQVATKTAIDQYAGAISVFKYDDGKLPLPTPANLAVNGMTVSWDAVSGAGSYKVTINGVEAEVAATSYEYTGAAGYYDVSVYAVPDETASATYKNSDAATLTKAKFGEPVLETPVLESNGVTASSVSAKWTVDPNASNGYLCQLYNGEDFVSDQTVSTGAVTFTNLTEDTEYTVKVQAKAVTEPYAYAASGVASIKLTPAGLHIKDITAAGTYNIGGLLVYAVSGNNVILGDNTGKILFYKSSHGLSVGDKVDVNGNVTVYYGVFEFNGAAISNKTSGNPVDHGTPVELSTLTNYDKSPVIVYAHATGVLGDDQRTVTATPFSYYLDAKNDLAAGTPVESLGYTYGYYSSKGTVSFLSLSTVIDGITVDKSSVSLASAQGSTAKVNVTSSVAWTANTSSDWTVSPTSGNAGTTEVTITASKAGGDAEATLADLVFTQTGTSKSATVTVKQQKTGGEVKTTKLTNETISKGSAANSYGDQSATDANGFVYKAYAIQNYHSKDTSSQLYWQIKKYASSTAYYIQLPEFPGNIKTIKLTVSSTGKPMTGGSNTATLYFSNSKSTSSAGNGVVSGTGASSIKIDASSLNLKSGYITAGGGIRIWDIEIEYND